MNRKPALAAASALALAAFAGLLVAGPVNPPAGPVAPTYKTLAEVEPRTAINAANTPGDVTCVFKITQPGSYYLTGNISVPSGKSGITIAANQVTVDLAGFRIAGQPGSLDGVTTATLSFSAASVRDGSIYWMHRDGISFGPSVGGEIENVRVEACTGAGIISNRGCRVRQCVVHLCISDGFRVTSGSVFQDCVSQSNDGNGFSIESEAILSHCQATSNSGDGYNGMKFVLDHCSSVRNQGDGFDLGSESKVSECWAEFNSGVGYRAAASCSIRECVATGNVSQGIYVGSRCSVCRNQARNNGGSMYAGIWLSGYENRAEENESTDNAWGIYISSTGNFVVRNTCANNVQGDFNAYNAATNDVAPVINHPGNANFTTMGAWSNVSH